MLQQKSSHLSVIRRELTFGGRVAAKGEESPINYWLSLEEFSANDAYEMCRFVTADERKLME
jgi:hypothetical protein